MRKSRFFEVFAGICVLIATCFSLVLISGDSSGRNTIEVSANFSNVSGLHKGSEVKISGVKIGSVHSISLTPMYGAFVVMKLLDDIAIPDDSAASISGNGLFGPKYVDILPGASDVFMKNGSYIEITESNNFNLESLIKSMVVKSG